MFDVSHSLTSLWLVHLRRPAVPEGDDEDEHVFVCSGTWYLLSWHVNRVLCFGTDCKHSPSTGEVVSTQDKAEKKRKKAEEARLNDTQKTGCWKFWKEDKGARKGTFKSFWQKGYQNSTSFSMLEIDISTHRILLRVYLGLTSEIMLNLGRLLKGPQWWRKTKRARKNFGFPLYML